MQGQRIAYVRVSTVEQNADRQLEGLDVARTFIDRSSGGDTHRPELEVMLRYVRAGDTIVVHSMDRLARNLTDLRQLVESLTERQVRVEFVKEHLTFTGDDAPMATLMLSVMGAVAEFERALIRERQREGIALAKERGVYRGRRRSLSPDQIEELCRRARSHESVSVLAREYGISRPSVYRHLQAAEDRSHQP